MFQKISVIGTGFLGASILRAIQKHFISNAPIECIAWDLNPEHSQYCLKQNWCDAIACSLEEAVSESDFILLCTPVDALLSIAEQIVHHLRPQALVTDVGSTKDAICKHFFSILPHQFIGSHPMAGSEKTGPHYASPEIFQKRPCLITPFQDSNPHFIQKLKKFWEILGMETHALTPEEHDRIVAHISHLPHCVASILASYLYTKDKNQYGSLDPKSKAEYKAWKIFSGTGLRDTTRIAASNPHLWVSIAKTNQTQVLKALEGFQIELVRFRSALLADDFHSIFQIFEQGKIFRDDLDKV